MRKNIFYWFSIAVLIVIVLSDMVISATLEKKLPQHVEKRIVSDYASKETKPGDVNNIILEKYQAFRFAANQKEFVALPFTYIPEYSSRKCVIRILSLPKYSYLQDLSNNAGEEEELPCNGVIALSFKDINKDGETDIVALYDYTTTGNKFVEPEVCVFTYNKQVNKYQLNEQLSEKAAKKRIKTMKDVLRNLAK